MAIYFTQPDALAVWKHETVDRYASWEWKWDYLDPYYIYRTAVLVLPWAFLYVFALPQPWVREMKDDSRSRLLWWTILVPIAILHVSLGRRWYYMHPAFSPSALLMAAFVMTWLRKNQSSTAATVALILAVRHVLALGIALIWLFAYGEPMTRVSAVGLITMSWAAIAAITLLEAENARGIEPPDDVQREVIPHVQESDEPRGLLLWNLSVKVQ